MKTKQPKIAIIQFPGTNCEYETKRAVDASGMSGEFFRWNEDYKKLDKYDGYILAGGFSYEDRSRSGIIASLDPIMKVIKKEAEKNKPVFGICNGAQILLESGLIPGLENYRLGGGLAVNKRVKNNKVLGTGFYNTWVHLKTEVQVFGSKIPVIKIPIAHGEGRFLFDEKLLKQLIKNNQIVFRYSDKEGTITNQFPTNPNGSVYNIAGVSNTSGNVIAMMPHPERCDAGLAIFKAMKNFILQNRGGSASIMEAEPPLSTISKYIPAKDSIQIFVELIITDNEAVTVENTLKQLGYKNIKIKKRGHWEIETEKLSKKDLDKKVEEIILSGELLNTNKEIPNIKMRPAGVSQERTPASESGYLVRYKDDFVGQSKLAALKKMNIKGIKNIKRGIVWKMDIDEKELEKVLKTNIFYNPFSQDCFEVGL